MFFELNKFINNGFFQYCVTKEQYDEIAEEYSQMLNQTKKYVLIPTFKKLVGDVAGKSVLDLACGEGFFTRILAQLNPEEVVGVDISNELIKRAIEIEEQNPSGINYETGNVLTLKLNRTFDMVSAVYLLNYSKTNDELATMCKNIYDYLATGGKFCAITTNPALKPMTDFEYERRFTNVSGAERFKDGDQIKCEMREEGKKPFGFVNYYWSKKTYELCLRNAGFKSVQWINTIISQDGIKKYGNEYWSKFRKNPSPIGIICAK